MADGKLKLRVKAALCMAMLWLCLSAPAALAGVFEDIDSAIEKEDYATALRLLRPLAESGDAQAQYKLGFMYVFGLGLPKDEAQAEHWYIKAAENGDASAQSFLRLSCLADQGVSQDVMKWCNKEAEQGDASAQTILGSKYINGKDVPQDYAQAANWFRKAATQGDAIAQSYLGVLYHYGRGVPQDYGQAVYWWRKSAEQGNGLAQNNLGTMYEYGHGVAQDFVQAHLWYNLAAASSAQEYAEARKKAAENRDRLATKMTPAQIAEAQRLAREWKPE